MLLATRHKRTRPALTLANKAGTRLLTPEAGCFLVFDSWGVELRVGVRRGTGWVGLDLTSPPYTHTQSGQWPL